MLTDQEVFDIASNHLLSQNQKSRDSDGVCLFRGPLGMMCAVGPFIPNEKYDKTLELDDVGSLQRKGIIPKEYKTTLLLDLQRVHDRHESEFWLEELLKVAMNHGLSFVKPV